MTRGGHICLFSSLRSGRLAACLLRRRCTRTSSTTPAWSTARQSQCFTPAILSTTSSRCHLSPTRGRRRRIWLANCWPNELSDGFVADDDAAGCQQLLHHAQPERKAEIEPHGVADDLGWEPIPGVAGASGCPHPTRLLTPICSRKRGKAHQVDGAGATIIQCKHYAASGFRKLLAHLRDYERPKVERLAPSRYVVVTSVSLTPANKDEVVHALQPFVLGAHDVIGEDDLEGLLSRHSDVERANFKLWLTSTGVLERVLHNAELCQTDFEVDRVRRKLPLFVQNAGFPRAMQLLDDTRIVIISGVPGIGK